MKRNSRRGSSSTASDPENPPITRVSLRNGVMGKYYRGPVLQLIALDRDVAKDFPDAKAVNHALRTLREIQRLMNTEKRRKSA